MARKRAAAKASIINRTARCAVAIGKVTAAGSTAAALVEWAGTDLPAGGTGASLSARCRGFSRFRLVVQTPDTSAASEPGWELIRDLNEDPSLRKHGPRSSPPDR